MGSRTAAFDALISGRASGAGAIGLRLILTIFSWLYRAGIGLRGLAFRMGLIRVARSALPVVSLGNLTTGGTGKTPFAAWVARWFREQGVRVCILSRGYGAEQGSLNDEALVLEQLCPDVPLLQHPNRVDSARIAHEELDSQLLILDDGFQHRQLTRNLDIVLIDALNPWGYGFLLPRGLLREPLSALQRADLVVITRVDQVSADQLEAVRRILSEVCPTCGIAEVSFPPERLINADGQTATVASLRNQPVAAFCGIGNPEAFRVSLTQCGMQVVAFRTFADHHDYTRTDIEELKQWTAAQEVAAIVTTQKDLVKISLARLNDCPLWAVQIGAKVIGGADRLEQRLRSILEQTPRDPEG